jgi:O-succinylbenzoic acid--CoA ligase
MTETLTHVAIRKLNPSEDTFHTLPGVKIYLDSDLCLSIQANHLGGELIRTKDLVNIFSESSFLPTGRYDNVINTAGMKVLPEDVERKISTILTNQLPGCSYFIAGVTDSSFGQKVVLFVESTLINDSKKDALTNAFKEKLRAWEVPKEVACVLEFRRTKSGKVNRHETVHGAIPSTKN